jgi:hypothetical protein
LFSFAFLSKAKEKKNSLCVLCDSAVRFNIIPLFKKHEKMRAFPHRVNGYIILINNP